jgi:NAD(P)-dependent dehydrogenase (short-subunit alcohol dehydrogenase family)
VETLDVSDAASVAAAAGRIMSRSGRIDILVNNAGTNVAERHWDRVTPEKWKEVIDVDLNGAFYCARAVLEIMRKQQDGLIINVSSWAGRFYSLLTGPAYSAAKHGLLAMNASINMEVAGRHPRLRFVSRRSLDADHRPPARRAGRRRKGENAPAGRCGRGDSVCGAAAQNGLHQRDDHQSDLEPRVHCRTRAVMRKSGEEPRSFAAGPVPVET